MSGIKQELERLAPMGVVCWTQAEKDLFVDQYGCVPPGMVYEISDGGNAGIWVASKNEGEPDRCLATKDLIIPQGGAEGQYLTINADDDFVWVDFPTVEDGDSAYDIWLANGNTGTQADFLASLAGEDGDPGAPGTDICNLPAATPAQVTALKAADTIGVCIDGAAVAVSLSDLGLPSSGSTSVPGLEDVGSKGVFTVTVTGLVNPGDTFNAADLRWSATDNASGGPAPSAGVWRAHGYYSYSGPGPESATMLFCRIS